MNNRMSDEIDAVLDRIEEPQVGLTPRATPLEFLQAVYCNEGLSIHVRLKAASEAAQYVHPKLAVTANIDSTDFASRLDRAVKASSSAPRVISAVHEHPPVVVKPM